MRRRNALKAAGALLFAGTALTSSGSTTEDGPTVVSLRSDTTSNTDTAEEYTVEYLGDGIVKITGTMIAPNPCHEPSIDGINRSKYGDVVDLSLESNGVCTTVISALSYRIRLEYQDEPPDVFVTAPGIARGDGKGTDRSDEDVFGGPVDSRIR